MSVLLVGGCAAHPPPAPATPNVATPATTATPAAPAPRSPDAILADAVQAMGGAAAWTAHKTMHTSLTITLQGMGMGGRADQYRTSAGKALNVSTLPSVGVLRDGSNGQVFWSDDPFNGLRMLDGAEAAQAQIEDAWSAELSARTLFAKIETTPNPPAGLECLTLTPKLGPPLRDCYDRQTHLQVSQEGTRVSPQGNIPFRTTVSDWRSVGGMKLPYAAETHTGPVILVAQVNAVTFDEPVNDKMFEPPTPHAP